MKLFGFDLLTKVLEDNNRFIFSKLLVDNENLRGLVEQESVKLILVPSDQEIQAILNYSKLTLPEFSNSSVGQDILANHISNSPYQENTVAKSLNDQAIPLTNEYLMGLGFEKSLLVGKITVVFIDKILINQLQIDQFSPALNQIMPIANQSAWNEWALLPNDIFYKIIQDNQVRGQDLIALCGVNKLVNEKCNSRNQEIFRRLLLEEYGVESQGNHRQQYLEWSKSRVWTVGDGRFGKLGHGNQSIRFRPKMIAGIGGIKQVSCGDGHTALLGVQGRVWTFGYGEHGQLGHGDKEDQLRPKMIAGLEGIKQVSCGREHTAFLDSQGRVWTFGKGKYGQLGHGDEEDQFRPKMIAGFEGIKQVSCGFSYTAFLDSQGKLWTFGDRRSGKLGHSGKEGQENQLRPKMIDGFQGVKQVSCGRDHTAFIL